MAENKGADITDTIDRYVKNAQKALDEFMDMTQEEIDRIVKEMTLAGLEKHMELARLAVEETGRGVYEDKDGTRKYTTEVIAEKVTFLSSKKADE